MPTFEEVSHIVWKECLDAKPGEKALVVCDPEGERLEIGRALLKSGSKICDCRLMKMKPTGMAGREPAPEVAKAMLGYDIIIAPTEFSITHTSASMKARKAGARVATMPGITRDMFLRAIPVNYMEMDKVNRKLQEILRRGSNVRVTSKAGTDISMEIMPGRKALNDNGLIRNPGNLDNLPGGEVAIAPKEGSSNGTIVFDLTSFFDKTKGIFRVDVRDGLAVRCESKGLWDIISNVENGTNLAELGIGTNPKARITGIILEDEKVKGTAHIAFGTNASLGGTVQTSVHLDSVFNKPTIEVDGKAIIKEGKFLF